MRNIIQGIEFVLDVVPVFKANQSFVRGGNLTSYTAMQDDIDYLEQQAEDALSKAEVKDGYCTDVFTNAQSNSLKSNFSWH